MALELTSETLEDTVTQPGIVLVDFWASWCGPCRAFAPIFDAAAEKNPDLVFAKVDTQANQDVAMQLEIRSIPTLMVFRDGVLLYREAGALPPPALDKLIADIRALDMDKIRKDMAEGEAEA